MADNPTIDNGSLTDYVVAADDVGGALYQYFKPAFGADGSASIVTATNGLPVAAYLSPATSGGLSIFRVLDLDETEDEAKSSAGQVFGWFFANQATSWRYVKFYNATAASVTVGSTTPVLTLPLPPQSAANVEFTNGIVFSTAITIAATTGVADADTGAPAANDVVFNLFYK